MYVKILDTEIVNHYSVRRLIDDNPGTSFPSEITDQLLAEWNVFPLALVEAPTVNYTKNVIEGIPIFQGGEWVQTWDILDATSEEMLLRTEAQASDIRAQRNALLSETDWRFRSDMSPSQDWIQYCQSLRDITSQPNFPWEVVWPTQPE